MGSEADDHHGPLLRSDSAFSVHSFGSALGDPDSVDAGILVAPPGAKFMDADDRMYPDSLLDPSDSIDESCASNLGGAASMDSSIAYINSGTALDMSGVGDDEDTVVAADEDTDMVDSEFSSCTFQPLQTAVAILLQPV
jgi:hypothetical protein